MPSSHDIDNQEHHIAAKAKQVLLVDALGLPILSLSHTEYTDGQAAVTHPNGPIILGKNWDGKPEAFQFLNAKSSATKGMPTLGAMVLDGDPSTDLDDFTLYFPLLNKKGHLKVADANLDVALSTLRENGDTVYIGGAAYTVKKKTVNRATSGELIALVADKKLRVISGYFGVALDTTVTLKGNTTTGDFQTTGAMTLLKGGGMVLPRDPDGHLETASGEALDVTLGTACQISGILKYVEL